MGVHLVRQHRIRKQTHAKQIQKDKQTDRQTDRQTGGQTDRYTDRQTDKQTDRQTSRQTHRQTDTQTHRHSHRHTDTDADRYTHTHTRTHTPTNANTHKRKRTHIHTYKHTQTYTHARTHTHTHAQSQSHTHTRTRTHSHAQTHAHTHTAVANAYWHVQTYWGSLLLAHISLRIGVSTSNGCKRKADGRSCRPHHHAATAASLGTNQQFCVGEKTWPGKRHIHGVPNPFLPNKITLEQKTRCAKYLSGRPWLPVKSAALCLLTIQVQA